MLLITQPACIRSDTIICQGGGMSQCQWATLIIFVGFLSLYVLDLEVLLLEIVWFALEMLSLVMLSR